MSSTNQVPFTEQGIPTYQQFVLPAIRAVAELGGSAKTQEITDHIVENYPDAENLLQVTYPKRPEISVFTDRASWGRSAAKLIGALEQPARGIYLTTDLGEQLLSLPEEEAYDKVRELVREMNREYDHQQHKKKSKGTPEAVRDNPEDPSEEVIAETKADDDSTGGGWKTQLLTRLHKLSPEGFEKFVLYLLRQHGLTLEHRGGSGDEGIDGIGTARFSPVLSSRVVVQIKRYDPNGPSVGREVVALFRSDAQAQRAERAILVTLSRFTGAARKAAVADSPMVELIDGDRLAELIREDGKSGVTLQPAVDESWFDRFD